MNKNINKTLINKLYNNKKNERKGKFINLQFYSIKSLLLNSHTHTYK